MSTVAWLDASAGASGDMMLGALAGVGVPIEVMQRAVDAVLPDAIRLEVDVVRRSGLGATRCDVVVLEQQPPTRSWRTLRELVAGAPLPVAVRDSALAVFGRLAEVEGRIHQVPEESVHFHEVGSLDSIADVVGACAGIHELGIDRWVTSPIGVGSGTVSTAHGALPIPVPAVVELLLGAPTSAGPGTGELCTPTGAALVAAFTDEFGAQPGMVVDRVGLGAGGRDPSTHPNVLRLLVGTATDVTSDVTEWVLEANVDDLDPRVWPHVLASLLDAGAADAWLTPILMKKGRPAHTLHVLVAPDRLPAVRRVVVSETTTIGFREHAVSKHALDRWTRTVEVDGGQIDVKVSSYAGRLTNAQPEYDQAAAIAARTGRPLRDVLDEARLAARTALED